METDWLITQERNCGKHGHSQERLFKSNNVEGEKAKFWGPTFPGLSDQASCYKPGREQTQDPGDVGDAEESLQDRQPTQRLWETSVF